MDILVKQKELSAAIKGGHVNIVRSCANDKAITVDHMLLAIEKRKSEDPIISKHAVEILDILISKASDKVLNETRVKLPSEDAAKHIIRAVLEDRKEDRKNQEKIDVFGSKANNAIGHVKKCGFGEVVRKLRGKLHGQEGTIESGHNR